MAQRVLIVLGGNAFARPGEPLTMAGQFAFARRALSPLRELLLSDAQLLITHGNGPQVGYMLTRVEAAIGEAYSLPLEACVADTEGELGYVLQVTLYNFFAAAGRARPLASLLTHVVVDEKDPAFQRPSKPIGPFFSALRSQELQRRGMAVIEDAGRGFRRVAPSPLPVEIMESQVIDNLLSTGAIVIAAGGGGIPIVRHDGQLKGVEAVIDKDFASALLGQQLQAQRMIILTSVPCAYRFFGTKDQQPIGTTDVAQARRLIDEGHFSPGSMLPKVQAAVAFADRPGAEAIICDPASLPAALNGKAGTIVRQKVASMITS